jgi:hypothetical protein
VTDDDEQMWQPPMMSRAVSVGQMFQLAKRLRTRAYWYHAVDATVEAATAEALIGFADELDKLFAFKSELTEEERKP